MKYLSAGSKLYIPVCGHNIIKGSQNTYMQNKIVLFTGKPHECNSIFIQICTRHVYTCTRFSVFKHRVVLFSGPILLPVVASSMSSVVRTCSYGSLSLVEGLLGSVADLLHHQVCHCQVSNLLTMFLFVCGRLSCTLKNKYLLPGNPQQQHPVDEYPQAATCPVFV